jgi:taurine dioxygenase
VYFVGMGNTTCGVLELEPLEPLGVVVRGLDLRVTPDASVTAALLDAVVEHGVAFLHDQALSDDEHLALARCFGSLSVYPMLAAGGHDVPLEFIEDTADDPPKADRWHSDLTWLSRPPKLAFLSARIIPRSGGDTMWADTQAAYEALPADLQAQLDALCVHHSIGGYDRFAGRFSDEVLEEARRRFGFDAEHPLVRTNPDSGRRSLFLGGYWMDHVVGVPRSASDALLGMLMTWATQARFTRRWHWRVDDLAIWDERRTMHVAVGDHYPQHRLVRRCTVDGEVPLGPATFRDDTNR